LLITDEPQSLLPTISSRCQRIALTAEDAEVSNQWKTPLLDILSDLPPKCVTDVSLLTGRVTCILNDLQKEIEDEEQELIPEEMTAKEAKKLLDGRVGSRMVEIRMNMLRTIINWQRDVLMLVIGQDSLHFPEGKEALVRQAANCNRAEALKRIAAVEDASRQLDRNLPTGLVFESFFSQMIG
jgi:DNA polymerase III delta prime subunit